jgi:hypothetical protein
VEICARCSDQDEDALCKWDAFAGEGKGEWLCCDDHWQAE